MTVRLEPRDRGSGSVLAVALIGVVAVVLLAALTIAAVAIAGQRARTAADLAALAGAGMAIQGADESAACGVAGATAQANGAQMSSCHLTQVVTDPQAGVALPSVSVQVSRAVARTQWTVRVSASAGGVLKED